MEVVIEDIHSEVDRFRICDFIFIRTSANVVAVIKDIHSKVDRFRICDFHFIRTSANAANVVARTLATSGLRGCGIRTWEAIALIG